MALVLGASPSDPVSVPVSPPPNPIIDPTALVRPSSADAISPMSAALSVQNGLAAGSPAGVNGLVQFVQDPANKNLLLVALVAYLVFKFSR